MKFRSVAVWPNTIKVGNVIGKNESTDTHDTEEQAEAVCRMLLRDGFGGEMEVFPLSTRVEVVEPVEPFAIDNEPNPAWDEQNTVECPACDGTGDIPVNGCNDCCELCCGERRVEAWVAGKYKAAREESEATT